MKKSASLFISLYLVSFLILSSSKCWAAVNLYDTIPNLSIEFEPIIGISFYNSAFNISGTEEGTNPNILSEVKWNNNSSRNIGTNVNLMFKKFRFRSSIIYLNTIKGDVSDIDYAEDNRTAIFSENYFSNHKGDGTTFQLSLGYSLFKQKRFSIDLYASFQHNTYTHYLLNKKHLSPEDWEYLSGLDSYYKYKHPNIGGALYSTYHLSTNFSLSINFTTYKMFYYAYGNWNLREDFAHPKSYEHRGKGIAFSPTAHMAYLMTNKLSFELSYWLLTQQLTNGKDELHLTTGEKLVTRLNQVQYNRHSLFFGIKYSLIN